MAYQRWWKTIRDQQGNAVNGASCAVYNGGTGTLATVYDPNTDDSAPGSLANPFVTTANGVFGFMAADGEYDVQISGGNGATQQYRVMLNGFVSGSAAALEAQLEPRNIKFDGAVVDGVTDDSAAVAITLSAAGTPGAICVPGESNIGAARIANQRGVSIEGPGLLEYTPSAVLGTRVQNAKGRDRLSWGSEYLYQFLVKFIAGTASTIRLSGDSTTAQSNQYGDYLTSMLANWPSITVTKAGYSGENTGDWLSTRLAGDITANADVLIWHWGMNDCSGQSRTLTEFEADLRAGLTTYRATRPIASNGIILMTPNASSDGTQGRDERFQEKIGRIIKNVAEDFQCAYFDTYGIFQDGYVGIGEWIDDPYADGLRGVHPEPPFAQAIAGEVLDLLIPPGVRRIAGDGGVSNSSGSTNPLATGAPTTYPAGVSIRRATTANGWPNDGFVVTFCENTNKLYAFQINYAYNTTAIAQTRNYASGAWQSFGLPLNVVSNATLSTAASGAVAHIVGRPAGQAAYLEARTAASARWRVYLAYNDSETGSNAGSSWALTALTDAAATIDNPIFILRASGGAITLGGSTQRPLVHTGHSCYTGKAFTANGATTTFTYPANTRYQYITTSAASLATTLPATSAALDGMVITFVAGAAVATATWVAGTGGATIVGAPAALVANTPVRMIYHHATTSWYPY